MYRPLTKRQKDIRDRKLEAMRRGKDRARMARETQGRAPDSPDLRRVVTVTDYDSGQPVVHTLTMHKTRRVDVYRVEADGKLLFITTEHHAVQLDGKDPQPLQVRVDAVR